MTSKAQMLKDCFGGDVSVTVVTFRGRKYVVTTGTGEMSYGRDGGGSAAFAYAASDLRSANLQPEGWEYSSWCNTVSTVEDMGLARKLARTTGLRLTRGGACVPVLDDAAFVKIAR